MGNLKGSFWLLLSTLFFSSSILCISEVIGYIPTFKLNALRFILGGTILLIVSKGLPYKCLSKKEYSYSLLRGVSGIALYYLLETAALSYITSSMVSILVCLCYVVEVVYSIWCGSRRLDQKIVTAVGCTLLGMILICSAEGYCLKVSDAWIGVTFMILASISWVAYIHLEKTKSKKLTTLQGVGLDMLFGGLCILPFVIGEQSVLWRELPMATYGQLIYLAVCPSALAYLFYNKGTKSMTPEICSLYMNLIPLISLLFVVIFTEGKLTGVEWLGIILVAASLLVSNIGNDNKTAKASIRKSI